jgi:Divergent InlB B-repeat domain
MKRFHVKEFGLAMLIIAYVGSVNAAVMGRIIDQSSSAPISGALVHLVSANMSYTTETDGLFTFSASGVLNSTALPSLQEVTCTNGFVSFSIGSGVKRMTINIFDASGRNVAPAFSQTLSSGCYTFDALSAVNNAASSGIFIARVVLDGLPYSFKIFSPSSVLQARSRNGLAGRVATSGLAKRAVALDSITVTKLGYVAVAQPISSYAVNLGDIAMTLQSYALSVSCNPANGGTVTMNPNMQVYPYGTQVTLTATPSSGYAFVNWTGNASGTSSMQIVMTNKMSVTANFSAVLPATTTIYYATAANVVAYNSLNGANTSTTYQNVSGVGYSWSNSGPPTYSQGQMAEASLLQFQSMSAISGKTIISATLILTPSTLPAFNNDKYEAGALLGSWSPSSVTWNSCPNYTPYLQSVAQAPASVAPVKFDLTAMVKSWVSGASTNYGVIIWDINNVSPPSLGNYNYVTYFALPGTATATEPNIQVVWQ